MAEESTLNLKLKKAALLMVRKAALKSKFGIDCFALVHRLLRRIKAKSASDFGVETKDADYEWGLVFRWKMFRLVTFCNFVNTPLPLLSIKSSKMVSGQQFPVNSSVVIRILTDAARPSESDAEREYII